MTLVFCEMDRLLRLAWLEDRVKELEATVKKQQQTIKELESGNKTEQ